MKASNLSELLSLDKYKLIIDKEKTIGAILTRNKGVGPGFDFLRIFLALYIFYGHTFWAAGSRNVGKIAPVLAQAIGSPYYGWSLPNHIAAVPVFFALSGFLVMGSAFRLRRVSSFLEFRFLRIFPALLVEVTLCAVVLGSTLTTLSTHDYFADRSFFRYFGNIVGWITFTLPGLFGSNPVQFTVNHNLWTLPSEFDCYLITAALMMTGLLYKRDLFTVVFAVVTIVFAILNTFTNFSVTSTLLPAFVITYYFFVGVLFFQWKQIIPMSRWLFLFCVVLSYGLLMGHHTVFIAPIFVTYCMAFIGCTRFPKLPLISTGDYSYGVYLYGFPIVQALVAAFPLVFIGHRYLLLIVGGICTCLFAAFSWHLIEKRVLAQKRHLPPRWFPIPAKREMLESIAQ